MIPPLISTAAKRIAVRLNAPEPPPDTPRKRKPKSPKAHTVRSKRASALRARLLAFKDHYSLTWEEMAYVMRHSEAAAILSVPTLKRFALAYVIPQPRTLELIELFMVTVDKLKRQTAREKRDARR
jgi:hypothetical protein